MLSYKKAIINKCKEFNLRYIDKVFSDSENEDDIINFCNNVKADGFILLQPFLDKINLEILRDKIKLRDLDCFTYKSLGRVMANEFQYLPQTARSIVKFIEENKIDLNGKNVIVANSNNVIGRPLSMYLNYKKATVTLFNSKSLNQEEKIKSCDIFISAIGKAKYYDRKFFTDNQLIIDVGINYKNGRVYGDIYI